VRYRVQVHQHVCCSQVESVCAWVTGEPAQQHASASARLLLPNQLWLVLHGPLVQRLWLHAVTCVCAGDSGMTSTHRATLTYCVQVPTLWPDALLGDRLCPAKVWWLVSLVFYRLCTVHCVRLCITHCSSVCPLFRCRGVATALGVLPIGAHPHRERWQGRSAHGRLLLPTACSSPGFRWHRASVRLQAVG
jgi:hypothetical protein